MAMIARLITLIFLSTRLLAIPYTMDLSTSNDVRRAILLGTFGFGHAGGKLDLLVSHVSLPGCVAYGPCPVGFLFDHVASEGSARAERNYASKAGEESPSFCFRTDQNLDPSSTFLDGRFDFSLEAWPLPHLEYNFSARVKVGGMYALFFYNCADGDASASRASFDTEVSVFSFDGKEDDAGRLYLSAGEENLPLVLGFWSCLFIGSSLVGAIAVLKPAAVGHEEHVQLVHFLMLATLLAKGLSTGTQALLESNFNTYGSRRSSAFRTWSAVAFVSRLVHGLVLYTTVVLLGSGVTVQKTKTLSFREKVALLVALLSLVVLNCSRLRLEALCQGDAEWETWSRIIETAQLVPDLAVLFPMAWSMQTLQNFVRDKENEVKDGSSSASDALAASLSIARHRLTLFRRFYIVVVCYIYASNIVIQLLLSTVSYERVWVVRFAREAVAFIAYVTAGSNFRPSPENLYLHVPTQDEPSAATMRENRATESALEDPEMQVNDDAESEEASHNSYTACRVAKVTLDK